MTEDEEMAAVQTHGVQHPGLFEQVCFILNDTFKRECGLQTPFVVVL